MLSHRRPLDAERRPTIAAVGTRAISFEELTQLLRRPRPRRKAVPAEQLALFGDEVG